MVAANQTNTPKTSNSNKSHPATYFSLTLLASTAFNSSVLLCPQAPKARKQYANRWSPCKNKNMLTGLSGHLAFRLLGGFQNRGAVIGGDQHVAPGDAGSSADNDALPLATPVEQLRHHPAEGRRFRLTINTIITNDAAREGKPHPSRQRFLTARQYSTGATKPNRTMEAV